MDNLSLEDQQLVKEYTLRSNALSSMSGFRDWMAPSDLLDFKFPPALHHKVMMGYLERWRSKPGAKLMIFLPFGSAKTVYTSVQLPTWLWANDPSAHILAASNTQDFAESIARRRRDVVMTPEFETLSGAELRSDSKSVKEFTNTVGGIMRAVGVSASCTGFRSGYNILDDPHIDFEQLQSKKYRDDIYSWYTGIFRSRLSPGGNEIICTTRFSDDDLAGRLLKNEGDDWEVLRIPEIADEEDDPLGRDIGERIWPEYLSEDRLLNRERDPRLWLGCYMQKPPAESGTWLGMEDIEVIEHRPPGMTYFAAMDLALSVGRGDWTVIIIFGVDPDRNLILLDMWRKQKAVDETSKQLCQMCVDFQPDIVLIDNDNASKVFKSYSMDAFRRNGIHTPLKELPTAGNDKEVRAAAFRGLARQGRVKMLKADWNSEVYSEILAFPLGADDIIDTLSLAGRHIAKASGGRVEVKKPPQEIKGMMQSINGKSYTSQTLGDLFKDNDDQWRSKIIKL